MTFNLQPTNLDIYDMNISHPIPRKIALTYAMIWAFEHGIGDGGDDTIGDGEFEPDLILGPGWCRQPGADLWTLCRPLQLSPDLKCVLWSENQTIIRMHIGIHGLWAQSTSII